MKKINIASLVIAFIIFILYVLDYNFGGMLTLVTMFGFGWIDDMGYTSIINFIFPEGQFPFVMVLIISFLGYLITFVLLTIFRFIIKVIISLFK